MKTPKTPSLFDPPQPQGDPTDNLAQLTIKATGTRDGFRLSRELLYKDGSERTENETVGVHLVLIADDLLDAIRAACAPYEAPPVPLFAPSDCEVCDGDDGPCWACEHAGDD